jgi:hypothetical protein
VFGRVQSPHPHTRGRPADRGPYSSAANFNIDLYLSKPHLYAGAPGAHAYASPANTHGQPRTPDPNADIPPLNTHTYAQDNGLGSR